MLLPVFARVCGFASFIALAAAIGLIGFLNNPSRELTPHMASLGQVPVQWTKRRERFISFHCSRFVLEGGEFKEVFPPLVTNP